MRTFWLLLCLLGLPVGAQASDFITLGEVLEALQGTQYAELVVAPAPAPGGERVVRRRDIQRVLREHDVPSDGLRIPRFVRVGRASKELQAAALRGPLTDGIQAVVGACEVLDVTPPSALSVGTGELVVQAEPPAGSLRTGSRSIAVEVSSGGRPQRVLVRARIECPPPVMGAGDSVRIVVQIGAVRASAPGKTRQPGRVGDVISVINMVTGARLMARVVDNDTVEVTQ